MKRNFNIKLNLQKDMADKTFIMIPYTVGYTIGKGFNSEVEDITKGCCACPFKDEAALES
jgi:hypothetical protein